MKLWPRPLRSSASGLLGVTVALTGSIVETACQQSKTHEANRTTKLSAVSFRGNVIRAVDGDTIVVERDGLGSRITVRLLGVDTPETHDPRKPVQCYGPEAANFTRTWATGRVLVRPEPQTNDVLDRYGRTVAYVYVYRHRRDLGESLLRRGFAHVYVFRGRNFLKLARYRMVEFEAKVRKVGLWGNC